MIEQEDNLLHSICGQRTKQEELKTYKEESYKL